METVLARLERVADRLERGVGIAIPQASATSPTPSAATIPSVSAAPAPQQHHTQSSTFLHDYDTLLAECLKPLVSLSSQINPEAQAAVKHLEKAFLAIRGILDVSSQSKKPDMSAFQQLLQPVGAEMVEANKLAEGRRTPSFNHVKAVAEAIQALSWLAYTGPETGMNPPAQHVADCWSSAEFFANKVLMEFRSSGAAASTVEPNIAWVKALKELLKRLEAFVGLHFPAGLKWNPGGGPASAARTTTPVPAPTPTPQPAPSTSRPAAPRGPPPPPPGPPPKPLSPQDLKEEGGPSAQSSAGSHAALFAELQKGEAITSGLKKVTADMKTKNQPDRVGVVSLAPKAQASSSTPPAGANSAAAAAPKPPVCEFDHNRKKWTIENQVGVRGLNLGGSVQSSHTVYIFNCKDSVIQVPTKVNAISIDSCTKTGVVFGDLISSCEAINCSRLQLQCTGSVPTLAIEKTDGVQLYLPEALASQEDGVRVITAKCSEVNIVVVPASEVR